MPTRRDALAGAGLFGLGAITPSRFPYDSRPQPAPAVGPSPASAVRARTVVIAGAGGALFVYSGPPALGNLIASITGVAGTDSFGNVYLAGVSSYAHIGATPSTAIRFAGGSINYFNWTGSSWGSPIATISTGGTTVLSLSGATGVSVPLVPFTATAGTLANPTNVLSDTWHQLAGGSLINGWALNGNVDYTYNADDTFSINGRITNAAGTAGNSQVTTMPAGYAPLNRTEFMPASDSNGTAHSIQLDTSGHLQVNGAVAAGGTVTLALRIPRSAPA